MNNDEAGRCATDACADSGAAGFSDAALEAPRHARIIGARCTSQETLHAFLKKSLHFPDYYGGNLSALADCLSEACTPLAITVCLNEEDLEPGMQAYLLRFVQVCAREALANKNVSLVIEHW